MPAGMMIPAAHMPSMLGRNSSGGFGSSSGLTLSQPNLMEEQHQQNVTQQQFHHHTEMAQLNPEGGLSSIRDDEFDSKSCSENLEGASGDDQDPNQRPNKKKRYHRHTQHQIQEMEA